MEKTPMTNMTLNAFETVSVDSLATAHGGSGTNLLNFGKAAVNGGVNLINFFNDHPVQFGPWNFSVGGGHVTKPFTDDPLSKAFVEKIPGKPHAAPLRKR
jgi:hypothetical protein